MTDLERECRVFTRYLMGCEPTAYVVAKYLAAHQIVPAYTSQAAFDRRLVSLARSGPYLARLADAYARLFAARGVLRKKLVLLLAILETSPELHRALTYGHDGGPIRAALAAAVRVAGAILTAVIATLVIGVVRLLTPRRGREH